MPNQGDYVEHLTKTTDACDVRFHGVEKTFGNVTALHPLDLEIERGTLFSLLGPSGCGKTTTLRLLAGFEQPTRGRLFIRNRDVTNVPAYKRNFGMVFQSFALFPHLSVAENVAFGLRNRRKPKDEIEQKVKEALELVELGGFAARYPRQLSGGQQQRVALARAIVFEPDVLLLDEPLGALDKLLRDQMQVEIRGLQRRLAITTIFVTHDQDEALTMSDRVAVMKDGRIQQSGTPKEIYNRPRSEFVATFLGASNILTGTVRGHDGDRTAVEFAGRVLLVERLPDAEGSLVKFALRPEKIVLRHDAPVRATVKEAIYRGAQTYINLDVAGVPVSAEVANSGSEPISLEPSSVVGIDWDDSSFVALR